jgi:hypothetical protein
LIKARPLDFVEPKLETHSSTELRKSELTGLQAVPVLFHSGYQTIDKKLNRSSQVNPVTQKMDVKCSYSFKLPNYEVFSYYCRDCFNAIFPTFLMTSLISKQKSSAKVF